MTLVARLSKSCLTSPGAWLSSGRLLLHGPLQARQNLLAVAAAHLEQNKKPQLVMFSLDWSWLAVLRQTLQWSQAGAMLIADKSRDKTDLKLLLYIKPVNTQQV